MPRKSAASEDAPRLMRREEIAAFRVNTKEHRTDEVRMGDSPDRETHHSLGEKERRSVQKRRPQLPRAKIPKSGRSCAKGL